MAANMTGDLLSDDMDFMLSQISFLTTVCSTFNPTCHAQMRNGIHLLNMV